jgi:hypothetical protein
MRITVKSVEALEKYQLLVKFSDGVEGVIDLSHLAGAGVFKSWDEGNDFFDVFISEESKAIAWPGDVDIDTYNIYSGITGMEPREFLKGLKHDATHLYFFLVL